MRKDGEAGNFDSCFFSSHVGRDFLHSALLRKLTVVFFSSHAGRDIYIQSMYCPTNILSVVLPIGCLTLVFSMGIFCQNKGYSKYSAIK